MGPYDTIGFIKSTKLPKYSFPFKKPKSIAVNPEEYRRYLISTGLMEFLTKFLSKLSTERPMNPIEKLKEDPVKDMEILLLKEQLAEANKQIQYLEVQNKKLKQTRFPK